MEVSGLRTYRAGAGVPPDFRWFLPCRWSFEVNASVVLWMNPLHLISWFLKRIKTTLCPLNPNFFILRNCIQRFDHWIHSLAVPCRHLCDTYLKRKKHNLLILTGLKLISFHAPASIKKGIERHKHSLSISMLKLETTHAFYIGDTHTTVRTIKSLSLYNALKDPEKGRQERNIHKFIHLCFIVQCVLGNNTAHFSLQSSHRYPQAVLISICSKLDETKLK